MSRTSRRAPAPAVARSALAPGRATRSSMPRVSGVSVRLRIRPKGPAIGFSPVRTEAPRAPATGSVSVGSRPTAVPRPRRRRPHPSRARPRGAGRALPAGWRGGPRDLELATGDEVRDAGLQRGQRVVFLEVEERHGVDGRVHRIGLEAECPQSGDLGGDGSDDHYVAAPLQLEQDRDGGEQVPRAGAVYVRIFTRVFPPRARGAPAWSDGGTGPAGDAADARCRDRRRR